MKGELAVVAPLPSLSWDTLARLPIQSWLWLDMTDPAIRLAHDLRERPVDATHVWGWGASDFVRVRLDPDLPGGMVGAHLTVGTDPALDEPGVVVITETWGQTWAESDTTVNPRYPRGVVGGQGVVIRVARPLRAHPGRLPLGASLQFVSLAPSSYSAR